MNITSYTFVLLYFDNVRVHFNCTLTCMKPSQHRTSVYLVVLCRMHVSIVIIILKTVCIGNVEDQ